MVQAKNKRSSLPTISTSKLTATVMAKYDQIPKKLTRAVLQSFLTSIETHVAAGSKVRIDKIGILIVKDAAARKGRNPQTGEEIQIAARKKITFRTSSSLKDAAGIKKKASALKALAKKKK